MSIIFNTLFGILFFTVALLFVIGFVFREQIRRLSKYLTSWWAEDTRREERERRIRDAERKVREAEELREAIAREKAEAEILELGLQVPISREQIKEPGFQPKPNDFEAEGTSTDNRSGL